MDYGRSWSLWVRVKRTACQCVRTELSRDVYNHGESNWSPGNSEHRCYTTFRLAVTVTKLRLSRWLEKQQVFLVDLKFEPWLGA